MSLKMIFIIILLLVAISCLCAASDIEGVKAYKVGNTEIFMIVEAEREGTTDILIDAPQETLRASIPEGGFNRSTNAFLVKTPIQTILVDTGTGSGGVIMEKMKQLGIEPHEVDTVLLTHLHFDHFGGLAEEGKKNFPNAKIYLSIDEYRYFIEGESKNQSAIDILALYNENVETFSACELNGEHKELFHGITPIANYGHTPGHTVFLLENEEEKFIIAGDFLHVAIVQFLNPDISAQYDVDPKAAATSRRAILDYAAKNNIPIGGMHIVYPGMGTVEAEGNGFRFTEVK